ncbi:hypothetical protein [Methanobrevibacter sp.]|uniref:hypothetical protein n=1 Tax=Methanobrevibacter sp. TaxID=66852 RepID=UPI003867EC69
MKHIKIICLSLIILICCLSPVIATEINENGNNNTCLKINDTQNLKDLNSFSKKYPRFHMFFVNNVDGIYSQNDDIRFEITFDPNFHGPLKIYLDGEYLTTVYPDFDNVIIGLINYHLPQGAHRVECEFEGDENFYLEYCGATFYIV